MTRRVISFVLLAGVLPCLRADAPAAQAQTKPEALGAPTHSKASSPLDLGLLEAPDRATWQKPDQIMDALKVGEGSTVADIGAGAGWFTIRLARRVRPKGTPDDAPKGKVFAEDVDRLMIEAIKRRVTRENLEGVVETRLGAGADPNLPLGMFHAVLVVDSYQEVDVDQRVPLLRNLAKTLRPNGLIGIVNWKPGHGGPGPDDVRVAREVVEKDARAAGLKVLAREDLPYQYLLVLSP